ncbi:MAG: hypothetical protein OEM01_01635 [Desulfobulbaceae bacterium]|nr:hypothetical protein [Desulfobulbaceae bacterium]
MKNACVLCICTIVSLISSAAFSDDSTPLVSGEYNFSGQFTAGSSNSEYHEFTLTTNSTVAMSMSSTCDVANLYLAGDVDKDGTFDKTMGQPNPENSIWYGSYPLAGPSSLQPNNHRYRVWLSCPGHNEESYNITISYTEYNPDLPYGDTYLNISQDSEPNNNKSTATEISSQGNIWPSFSGHLGFFFDITEPYNNDFRDGLDYYEVELAPGSYTLHVIAIGQELLEYYPPYAPTVSLRNESGSVTVLSENAVPGTDYGFGIQTAGTYYVSVVSSKIKSAYTDMPYGAYKLVIEPHICTNLELGNVQVEDNVCGNTETISTTLKNPCTSEAFNDDLKVILKVKGPSYSYEKTAPLGIVNILPNKSITLSHNWFIPKEEFTGIYTSCIEVQKSANSEVIGETCAKSYVLCKPVSRAHLMLLLRARKSK